MTDWLEPRPAGAPVGIVCGTMNFGKRTPEDEAHRIVARALERGVTLFDTANAYGDSELILGRALRGRRGARIASKVGSRPAGGAREGLEAEVVLRACDESLQRLGVDRIDLYYLHWPDMRTPLEETLSALQKLIQAGKIAHWGVSNYASWQLVDMERICARTGLPRPTTAQQIYNLLVRQLDVEYWAFARQHPLHTTVYNPLAGGLLAGRALRSEPPKGSRFDGNKMYQRRYLSDRFFELAGAARLRLARGEAWRRLGPPRARRPVAARRGHRRVREAARSGALRAHRRRPPRLQRDRRDLRAVGLKRTFQ